MQVVRQAHVDILALIGWDEGRDYEVDVREQEQKRHGPCRAEGRGPISFGTDAGQVEIKESRGDERIDNGQRIGDDTFEDVSSKSTG